MICMRAFYERNCFLKESIDLSSVISVVKGANQCHNLVSSWIWMEQMQLGRRVYSIGCNQTGLLHYNDRCLSTIFKECWSILYSLVTLEVEAGRVGSETWGISARIRWTDLKSENEWSPMSSCDLIPFPITVSCNHREQREMMKG